MTLVVDASVACKWFVEEAGSRAAEQMLVVGNTLIAPDLIIAEGCNIFWRKVRTGQMNKEHALAASSGLVSSLTVIVPCAQLIPRAMEVSLALNHPAYDCFYLALAAQSNSMLVTADKRFTNALKGTAWARYVEDLSSIA